MLQEEALWCAGKHGFLAVSGRRKYVRLTTLTP